MPPTGNPFGPGPGGPFGSGPGGPFGPGSGVPFGPGPGGPFGSGPGGPFGPGIGGQFGPGPGVPFGPGPGVPFGPGGPTIGECSVTCGLGFQLSQINCSELNENCIPYQYEPCYPEPCPEPGKLCKHCFFIVCENLQLLLILYSICNNFFNKASFFLQYFPR